MNPSQRIEATLALRYSAFELDLGLSLPAGGVTALFGPSGSGKTTCLRCFAGLEPDCRGRIVVAGDAWQDAERGRFVPAHRRPYGFVFQDARLFTHLSVQGNLRYALKRAGGDVAIRFDEAVRLLGLSGLLARDTGRLSAGERQRCAIARALLTQPRLLLLDEPLAALDDARKGELLLYLEKLRDTLSIPMIYVSHSMREVARLADHLVLLDGGRVQASGPIGEVTARIDLPFSDGDQAGVVLQARCAEHDDAFALTRALFAGGELWLPRVPCEPGATMRVRIAASDVSLALERPRGSSVLNVLPAVVAGRRDDSQGRSLVQLDLNGASLLARVTRRSAEALQLRPGLALHAQIKAAAAMR